MASNISRPEQDRDGSVEAFVSYMKPISERPRRYLYTPPVGEPEMNWDSDSRRVVITDARPIMATLTLEQEGFVLRQAPIPAIAFDDESQVRAKYYPEIEDLVRNLTGATRVIVFDHNVRSGSKAARKRRGAFPPAHNVHADYTLKSGPQRLREVTGEDLSPAAGRAMQIINVWRPLGQEVETDALAVASAATVSQGDLVATDLKYPDRVGEFYSVTFNPAHRWHYVSRMRPDEMLIFKNFDSRDPARANCVPHAAFQDPNARADAPPRESIEVRAIAILD